MAYLQRIVGLRRRWKRLLLIVLDSLLVSFALWSAFALRLGDPWSFYLERGVIILPLMVIVTIPVFYFLGFYRSLLRYVSGRVFYDVATGAGVATLVTLAIWVLAHGPLIPRSTWLIHWIVTVLLIGSVRLLLRRTVSIPRGAFDSGQRVAIYGAGDAGAQLAVALQHSREFRPVVFVDSSVDLQGSEILGVKVYPPAKLEELIPSHEIGTVLLAMPSLNRRRRREILSSLESLPVRVLAMPSLPELASGAHRVDELRDVDVADVLGREPVAPDPELLAATIRDKVVLVTGGGGSIGSELCRQILRQKPRRLLIFEIGEHALYEIERELRWLASQSGIELELYALLGSVTDPERLRSILSVHAVATVFHAAAYKHVPLVEINPIAGVVNNVLGTLHAAQAAIDAGVETFVLVSTDKAVRPTNVMGASKRVAELVLQALATEQQKTTLCMVRFGNVLASSGSVVPLFREQIRRGGPVTVTDPDVVRYFMTIPEAAQLVIQAAAMATGGDVFLLEMGEPVRILDLARRMIHLSGYEVMDENNPDGDIEIRFMGLRPGEKLYEELLIDEHNQTTEHPMIMRAHEQSLPWAEFSSVLEQLATMAERQDCPGITSVLTDTVSGYRYSGHMSGDLSTHAATRAKHRLESQYLDHA